MRCVVINHIYVSDMCKGLLQSNCNEAVVDKNIIFHEIAPN